MPIIFGEQKIASQWHWLRRPSLLIINNRQKSKMRWLWASLNQGNHPILLVCLKTEKKQGNLTLAITNEPNSPLAKNADFILDIQAGDEKAVAATKTYTSQLMTIAMLSAALSGEKARWDELAQIAEWADTALKRDPKIAQAAQRYRYMQQCVVLGRGYNYATAFEWALKLKELTYVAAGPYS